jgi:hypothetical protein
VAVHSTRNASIGRNSSSTVVFSVAYGAGALLAYVVLVLLGWADVVRF